MSTIASVTAGGSPAGSILAAALGAAASAVGTAGKAGATAKARPAAKATTSKAPTAKTASKPKTTSKATTKARTTTTGKTTGYATRLPADYAYLRDPRLSIEEKLSRFIGQLMARSEQDLLAQMEKMAPGSTANAAGGAGGSATAPAAPKPKAKFSLWGLAKSVVPALDVVSKVVGDANLKALATQVSGPVLAAAATAVGLPQLAPLAQKLGPALVNAATKEISLDLPALTGGAVGVTAGGAAGSTGGTSSSGGAKATAGGSGTSEKAQLMELQRLQDRDKELFTLFSNMLKAMHDARMTSIQNIR